MRVWMTAWGGIDLIWVFELLGSLAAIYPLLPALKDFIHKNQRRNRYLINQTCPYLT